MNDVTRILSSIEQGDPSAAEQLLPLVYDELRRLAAQRMAHEVPGQTLQATALVHEAYLRLVDNEKAQHWNSRGHFFGAAAEAMRRILIDNARRKGRPKHGGGLQRVDLGEVCGLDGSPAEDLLALDEALTRLASQEPAKAELVKLRFYGGLSLDEACGDDRDLRAQVEKLLRAHSQAGSFLGRPVAGDRPTEVVDVLADPETPPDAINPPADETLFEFLESCDVPDRLGKLGPYEVIGVIGQGGMGVVFQAHDPKLNRVVAVKVLAPAFAANPTARKRFLREARAVAAVSHTHVVTIHAVEDDDKTPYLVMECIDGQTVQDKIKREGKLQIEGILRIGSQIAAGLAAAHGQGLVHRDIKPANILLENGVERVKITDFGLARAVDDIGITRTGDVAGTPEFMSPEQAQGLAVDHRTDLFSLGSLLYAMCTGRSPFRARTAVAALRRVCEDVPRPIREVSPEIPEELVAIIDRLLAKSPDERFQTADEVADLLGQYLAYLQHPTNKPPAGRLDVASKLSVKPIPDDTPRPSRYGSSRRRNWIIGGLVLLTVFASLAVTEVTGVTQFAAAVIRTVTGEGTEVVNGKLPPPVAETKAVDSELLHPKDEGPRADILPADAPAPAVAPFDSAAAKRHQQAWAGHLGQPIEIENSVGMKMVLIPPAEFVMGSADVEELQREAEKAGLMVNYTRKIAREGPQHPVTLSKAYYMGVCEVTQKQYADVMGTATDEQKSHHPQTDVSWFDAISFCNKLSEMEGLLPYYKLDGEHATFAGGNGYRLPTEAEWEFACRSGSEARWHFGDDPSGIHEYGWAWAGGRGGARSGGPHAVGELKPNPFGLFDMHGNVMEWCQDKATDDYGQSSPRTDPLGPDGFGENEGMNVQRGGSAISTPEATRSAFRNSGSPTDRNPLEGFRVAIDQPTP